MYKILIKTCSASNNIWNFYQEDGVDYVAASLEDMKPTALTLLKKYGKKNIKIIDQMSGQDMDNADVYIYDSTDNYEELNNRPYINGIEIVGQLTLEDLGIQPAGDYLNQNDLEEIENKIDNIDLSAYATNTRVDEIETQIENIDLTPYATKEFVSEEISNIDIPEVDLTDYATIQYVDDTVTAMDNTIYVLDLSNTTVNGGKFSVTDTTDKQTIVDFMEHCNNNDIQCPNIKIRTKVLNNTYTMLTPILTTGDRINSGNVWFYAWAPQTGNSYKVYTFHIYGTWTDGVFNFVKADYTDTGISNKKILLQDNTTSYTPTADYNPATKKYVDDNIPPTIVYKAFAPNDHTVYLTDGLNIASIDEVKTQLNNFIKDCIRDGNYNKILHLGLGKYNGRYQSYLFTEYEEGIQSYGSDPYVERRYFGCSVSYAGKNPKGQRRYLRTWDLIINVDDTLDEPVKKAILYVTSYGILEPNNTVAYTPTSDYNPATKKYVDDAVANIDAPDVDLSDYYNKTEVDDKLLTVDVNVEGLDIYSDEERVIGRWIDGRPLYQKYIYIGELTNGITDTHLDDYGIKAHEVRFHQVYKMGPDGILCLISPQFMSMAGKVIVRVLLYQEESGFNVLRVATGEGMDVEGHTAYAIVTYTKPDDEILLPTSDYYPATKKYVDDAIAGVSGGSGGEADLTNYYTKAEVDALLQALRDEFVSANNSINDKLETIIYGGE